MKKRVFAGSLILLIALAALLLKKEKPDDTVVGAEKISEIENTYAPLDGGIFLYANGNALAADANSHTFFLPTDPEGEWKNWQIRASLPTAEGDDLALYFEEDYTKTQKAEALAGGKKFRFLAVGSGSYYEGFLVFTGLPLLSFSPTEQTDETGQALFECRLYSETDGTKAVESFYTTAALHGNTSRNFEKKSLRLRLKKIDGDGTVTKDDRKLLSMRKDDDWILKALYGDSTRMRDKLAIDLWNEVGAADTRYKNRFGNAASYVEVVIGDAYQGIYLLMEPIDKKQLGLDAVSLQLGSGTDQAHIERLYKKKYTGAWKASDFTGEPPDPAAPDYRSGWYLKGDTVLENEQEWESLYELASLLEADEETFRTKITETVDVQNAVDNWLFYQAIGGFDNLNKNYYYVTKNENGSLKGYFVPWDMDLSFGAVYADNAFYSEESKAALTLDAAWEPGARMIETNAGSARELAAATWKKWRAGAFSGEALCARIDALEHTLMDSGAFAREMERWPSGNADPDLSFLRSFAEKRPEYLDAYLGD